MSIHLHSGAPRAGTEMPPNSNDVTSSTRTVWLLLPRALLLSHRDGLLRH